MESDTIYEDSMEKLVWRLSSNNDLPTGLLGPC